MALIGLGHPEETPVITVVGKRNGTHSCGEDVKKVSRMF